MKKIGLLSLALVVALGGLGIGFAAWTDTLYVDGTVNTGTVDIVIDDLSGSWVWKIVDTHEFMYNHGWGTTSDVYPYGDPNAPPEVGSILVASATADYDPADDTGDTVIVTFDNLYPCDWFWVDFLVHYPGTIPVRTYAEIETDDVWLQELWDEGEAGVYACEWDPLAADPHDAMGAPVDIHDVQLHECDWIKVILFIHIPQEDEFMSLDGSFTATVYAIQWNEYDEWVTAHEGG